MVHVKFAERIRQARRKNKFSQQELARLIGVQRSAVSNWESAGRVTPSVMNLIAIAKVTEVSVEWLASGRGPMLLGDAFQADIPAVDMDLVHDPQERDLLRLFRNASHRAKNLVVELAAELASKRDKAPKRKAV